MKRIPVHGGPDGGLAITHDFSTNANPLGPPPALWQAVLNADRRAYPDPHYGKLRQQLATAHNVEPERILPCAGGSEAIRRITLAAHLQGLREAWVPQPGFGDYALAAEALGMQVMPYADAAEPREPALVWICEPCNPTGASRSWAACPGSLVVVDRAYEPLRLQGAAPPLPEGAWELHCPNKALGLTGIRAAYLIAPAQDETWARLLSLASSWVLSAEGVEMLAHRHDEATQAWLADSREHLRQWSAAQRRMLGELGWQQADSCTPFWLAKPPRPLPELRQQGIKLRDATSFGLPGWVRIAALPPASQHALLKALTR